MTLRKPYAIAPKPVIIERPPPVHASRWRKSNNSLSKKSRQFSTKRPGPFQRSPVAVAVVNERFPGGLVRGRVDDQHGVDARPDLVSFVRRRRHELQFARLLVLQEQGAGTASVQVHGIGRA